MPKEEIERLFYQVAGPDGEIDWQELKRLLDQIMKDGKRPSSLSVNVSGSHSIGIPNRHVSNRLLMLPPDEQSLRSQRMRVTRRASSMHRITMRLIKGMMVQRRIL